MDDMGILGVIFLIVVIIGTLALAVLGIFGYFLQPEVIKATDGTIILHYEMTYRGVSSGYYKLVPTTIETRVLPLEESKNEQLKH